MRVVRLAILFTMTTVPWLLVIVESSTRIQWKCATGDLRYGSTRGTQLCSGRKKDLYWILHAEYNTKYAASVANVVRCAFRPIVRVARNAWRNTKRTRLDQSWQISSHHHLRSGQFSLIRVSQFKEPLNEDSTVLLTE